MSVAELLDTLTTIHEVLYHYDSDRRHQSYVTLTNRTPRQQQLLDLLEIPVTCAK